MNESFFNSACFDLDVPADCSFLIRAWIDRFNKYELFIVRDLKEFCRSFVVFYEESQDMEGFDVSLIMNDQFTVIGFYNHKNGFFSNLDISTFVGSVSGILENVNKFSFEG